MKTVMVLTNVTGNEELDRQRAAEYCRFAAHKGNIPLSPYLCFHGVFKDELAGAVEGFLAERLVKNVDEVWVSGLNKGKHGRKGKRLYKSDTGRRAGISAIRRLAGSFCSAPCIQRN